MMSKIVKFFQSLPNDVELRCVNHALIRIWLVSLPVFQSLESWMQSAGCLDSFMLKYDIDPCTYSFSVSLTETDSKLRVWKGKARWLEMYQIVFKDILAIVRMSCDSSFFSVMHKVCAQQRGAAIGNQISRYLPVFLLLIWSNAGLIHIVTLWMLLHHVSFAFGM